MRILALDVGTKTCGIAATDELGMTVQPVTTLRYKGEQQRVLIYTQLQKLLDEYQPKIIVIGLPYNMDGSEGPQAAKVRGFIAGFKNHLKKTHQQPDRYDWHFFDERCTTEEAEGFLLEHDVSRKKRKEVIDKMAAVFILHRYLAER